MTMRAPDLSALPGGAQGLSCLKAKLGRLG